MAAYPFEGCCEHTSNAHSRLHCLLCDCKRPPEVVNPQPAPQVIVGTADTSPTDDVSVPDGYGVYVLIRDLLGVLACGRCGALVADPTTHTAWHGQCGEE